MAYFIEAEPGENLIANFAFVAAKNAQPFCFAVSDRAVYLPRSKRFAVKDPTYFERISLHRVVEIRIKRLKPYYLWALSIFFVLIGTAVTVSMLLPLIAGEKARVSGYPPALVVVGLVIPFISRRRYALQVQMVDDFFQWKPILLVDKASRNEVDLLFDRIKEATARAHLMVVDEREQSEARAPVTLTGYPVAVAWTEQIKVSGVVRPCFHCGKKLVVSRWDDWNGFIYQCPYCRKAHGKPWKSVGGVILAGLFFNALSFFFSMRPKKALALVAVFGLFWYGTSYLDRWNVPELGQLVYSSVLLLAPVMINMAMLLRHRFVLETADLAQQSFGNK